jgi:GTPase SAR1 family protein
LGEPVGKTAIISRFVKDVYPDVHVHTTSDVHTEGLIELGDKKIRVDILIYLLV